MVTETEERIIPESVQLRLKDDGYGLLSGILVLLKMIPLKKQWTILRCLARTILICGGVRGSKSYTAKTFFWSHRDWSRPQKFWIGAATYPLTKVMFNYIKDDARAMGILNTKGTTNQWDPGMITLVDGTTIETKSGTNPEGWASEAVDGIIIDEAAQITLDLYLRSLERLSEKRGWLLLVGTLEESLGWYPKLFDLWRNGTKDSEGNLVSQSFSLPTWENTYLFPGGRQDPEILRMESEMGPEKFKERCAGEPVPPAGLVHPEFRADVHIETTNWNPDLPILMGVDPGYSDACAYEFFQEIDGQLRGFFEVYERGKTVDWVIDFIQDQEFFKVSTGLDGPGFYGACDIYGDQHHHLSTVIEVWRQKTGVHLHSKKIRNVNDVDAQIHRYLAFDPLWERPRVVFDPSMKGILSNFGVGPEPHDNIFRSYRWDMTRDGQVVGTKPKDANNHGIKAFGYLLVNRYGFADMQYSKSIQVNYF